ncbi:MAG: hypothetical protein EAX86_04285 [Candidatus Heimdallarchaeota archaeon]|nr:hypothetical protein [Candidatus Heimdallarchaeota archaeon]
MSRNRLLVAILLFLLSILMISQVQTENLTPIYEFQVIKTPSVVRSWKSVSLLYPDHYHTPEEVYEELVQVANTAPAITRLFSLGESYEGREIYCMHITNKENSNPKAGALFVAEHHAREQITTEVSLRFILDLVNNYGTDPELTNFIDNQDIYFIPALNPDGLYYVVGNETVDGNPWLRKNMKKFDDDNDSFFDEDPIEDVNGDGIISEYDRYEWINNDWEFIEYWFEGIDNDEDGLVNEDQLGGVDLNRNYDYRWNDSTLDSGWGSDSLSEVYPGLAPFSEPETIAYRDFLSNKSFATAMSLHSGINATYFPWSSMGYWAESSLYYQIYRDFIELLPKGYLSGEGYSSSRTLPSYTTAGDWADWMYAREGCLVPLTFEIYHNTSADTYGTVFYIDEGNELILQWDVIYEYFAPYEGPAIQSVYEDIQTTFPYWLGLTPRLDIKVTSVSGNMSIGNNITIKLEIKNLSPLIDTIDSIEVLDESFNPLLYNGESVSIGEILAEETSKPSFFYTLENDLEIGDKIVLKIGNAYVGYYTIEIKENMFHEQSIKFDFTYFLLMIPLIVIFQKSKKKTL